MQIILQATHGVVSGAPDFFKRAFGDTLEDFERILLLPHDYIFNREWFERYDRRERLPAHQAEYAKLTEHERRTLVKLLSSCAPKEFGQLRARAPTVALGAILRFYVPIPKDELQDVWAMQKELTRGDAGVDIALAEDERVEDAGLNDEEWLQPSAAGISRGETRSLREIC